MAGERTPAARPSLKVFACPTCGGEVQIRALGQTLTVVCRACASIIDAADPNYRVLARAATEGTRTPRLELGQRGRLRGVQWEVIGYMERNDGTSVHAWSEYLLFNPLKGFRWLTESDGHWNYVLTSKITPRTAAGGSEDRRRVSYMDREYVLFHTGIAVVAYVVGEFYWQVRAGDTYQVEDYVRPPEILSREASGSEVIWSVGEYVDPDVISAAFQLKEWLGRPTDVAPNQPAPARTSTGTIGRTWGFAACALTLIQFMVMIFSHGDRVLVETFDYSRLDQVKSKTSRSFELGHRTSNVSLTLISPVMNDWLDVQTDLVDETTGDTIDVDQGVEHYFGSDDEGVWSEGGPSRETIVSSVAPGRYHLNLEPSTGAATSARFTVEVRRDVPTFSNYFLALLIVSIYPVWVLWRGRSFELQRWSRSDHSPYSQHREDS